jgi:hypothetical protein
MQGIFSMDMLSIMLKIYPNLLYKTMRFNQIP